MDPQKLNSKHLHPKPTKKGHCGRGLVKPRVESEFPKIERSRGWWSSTMSWKNSRELLMQSIVWKGRGTVKTVSVSKLRRTYKKFNPFNCQRNGWTWKLIRKAKSPTKCRVLVGFLLSRQFNLINRGIQLSPRCFLSGKEVDCHPYSSFTVR